MTTSPRAFILNLSNSNLAEERVLINSPLVDVATATNHTSSMREQNTNGFIDGHLKSNFRLVAVSSFSEPKIWTQTNMDKTIKKNTVHCGCRINILRCVKLEREMDGVIQNKRNVVILSL